MSFPISDIVNSVVSRETKSVTQAGFGTILLVTEADDGSPPFPGRVKTYSSAADALIDGFAVGTYVYDSMNTIFSQNPSPETVKVGLKYITTTPDASWTAALTAIRQVDTDWYGLTIESEVLADQKEVADFVEGAVNPKILGAMRSNDLDIINTDGPTPGSQTISNSGSVGSFPSATVPAIPTQADYELDVTVDSTLYQLAAISINIAVDWDTIGGAIQTALRAATGSLETCTIVAGKIKITSASTGTGSSILIAAGTAGTGSGDLLSAINALGATYVTVIDSAEAAKDDIASYLLDNSYERSFAVFNSKTNAEYIDAAYMGKLFPTAPGSSTWKFKTLASVTTEAAMTTDQRAKALAKKCNIYVDRGGIKMTEEGTVGVGEFIDIIRGIDWLESIIEQNIFSVLVNSPKIPFTDFGIAIVEGELTKALNQGVTAGVLAPDSITVLVPLAADVPTAEKAARLLADLSWSAELAGAIHFTKPINGTVSV